MAEPSRPPLRYLGGKWRAAPWILSFAPRHTLYLEPFSGGASVLLQKRRSKLEYLNDADGELVNFFKCLRERSEELIRRIELTPYSREEYARAFKRAEGSLERARRLYVRSWQARGIVGGAQSARGVAGVGWRFQRNDHRGSTIAADWTRTRHLHQIAARLRGVGLDCGGADEVMRRYDSAHALYYVDPPFLAATRSADYKRFAYAHELSSEEEHAELLGQLRSLKAMVLLSGYDSELYDDLLPRWEKRMRRMRTQAGVATECLWINPAAQARSAQRSLWPARGSGGG